MPSKSSKQERFMRIASHSKEFADKAGIPQSVAKEFHEEDKKKDKEKHEKSAQREWADTENAKSKEKKD